MLYELRIRNPKKAVVAHLPQVAWLSKQKVIKFNPGINIVYGPNGSGKSTLLSALAKLLHCHSTNWPRVTKQSISEFSRPTGMADGLLLVHDGMPARYLSIDQDPGFAPDQDVDKVDLIMDANFGAKSMGRMSAGQATITKLVRFLKAEPKSVRYGVTLKAVSPQWKEAFDTAVESLQNVEERFGMPKQHVLLLDEVERSLDFAKQAIVWKQLRRFAADGKHQVIIASHSIFAVNVPNASYIETVPGYLDTSRRALSHLLKDVDLSKPLPAAPATV